MEEITEEDYELELHGFCQEDDVVSDDERLEIEEALYQSMHYSETIDDKNMVNEDVLLPSGVEKTDDTKSSNNVHMNNSDLFTQELILSNKHIINSSMNIHDSNDDFENSKYLISKNISVSKVNKFIHKIDIGSSDSEISSNKKKINGLSCTVDEHSAEINNSKSKKRLLSNSDSDENDYMIIESASEDENLQVHVDSTGENSPQIATTPSRNSTRYFEESTSKLIKGKCFNCNQTGHYKSNCPQEQKPVLCIMCGVQGHHYKECPGQLCFNCNLPGHLTKSCTKKRIHWSTVCRRCYMPGHEKVTCADRWRQFHLTTKSQPKHIYGTEEFMKRTYCYNCGKEGHLGYECEGDRMDRYTKVNYPFVCNYRYRQYVYMAFENRQPRSESTSFISEKHSLDSEKQDSAAENDKMKKKKKKYEDIQITVNKNPDLTTNNNKRKKKKKKEENLQITVSIKPGKNRKVKSKENEEENLKITVSDSGKHTVELMNNKKQSINIEDAESESKKQSESTKKRKVCDKDCSNSKKKKLKNNDSVEDTEMENSDRAKNSEINTSGSNKTVPKKKTENVKDNVSASVSNSDEDVCFIRSVVKNKSVVNKNEIIVLSSDEPACNTSLNQPDVITISDSSEEDLKKNQIVEPNKECSDSDVIVLDQDVTNSRNVQNFINDDTDNYRTPFALVWGLPASVANTLEPLSSKIKKTFIKNMKKHNTPAEENALHNTRLQGGKRGRSWRRKRARIRKKELKEGTTESSRSSPSVKTEFRKKNSSNKLLSSKKTIKFKGFNKKNSQNKQA